MRRTGIGPVEPLFGRIDHDVPVATRRDLVRILFKRWPTVALCFVVVTVVTALAVAALPPTYEAQAKVLVRTEEQVTPAFFSGLAAYTERHEGDPVNRRLENEMALLGAAPIARSVAKELQLHWHEIYHPPLTQLTGRLADACGPFLERYLGVPHTPPSEAEVAAALQASVVVVPGESKSAETTSNLIVVSLKAPKAETARAALERMLEHYLSFDRRLTEDAAVKARALVNRELTGVKRQVAAAEAAMRDFLAQTRFDPVRAEGERRQLRTGAEGPITSARDNQTASQLKTAIVKLQSELADARQIYRPDTEPVQRLERSLALLEERLAAEVKVNAGDFSRYNRLERELRVAEEHADKLSQRLSEIDLFLEINTGSLGNRLVIEPPILPEKSDRKARAATGLLGAVLGLVFGVALAGAGEYADTTLGTREDVRRHIGVEVVATIPNATVRERRAALVDRTTGPVPRRANGRLAAPAEVLASHVTVGMNGLPSACPRGHALLVTSARPREGKTFTATLLANELVRLGLGRVLLTDAAKIDTTVSAFVERERQRFDWIVFDGETVASPGVASLARHVDGVVLVVEADVTRRHVIQHALEMLDLDDPTAVKVVLNRKRYHIPGFLYDRV